MKSIFLKTGEEIPTLIRGVWQLSEGHQINSEKNDLAAPLCDAIECGFLTFDCGDIYTGVENLLGEVKKLYPQKTIRIHTKYVPDLNRLHDLQFSDTQKIIDRSLQRLQVDCLDLVQFHWWDYSQTRYLDVLDHLEKLKKAGKIRSLGVTNFDTSHLKEMIIAGFEIVSIQMQISLLDRRSQQIMSPFCLQQGIRRFAYGTLLGGFLSEKWLNCDEPMSDQLRNRSLLKYKLLIDDWGGWKRFQKFLGLLSEISQKYNCSIAQIATQAILQLGWTDSVIVGVSPSHYKEQNRQFNQFLILDQMDLDKLSSWDSPLVGDVYEMERSPRHAVLMKYNLNQQ